MSTKKSMESEYKQIQSDEIDLLKFFKILWRWKWLTIFLMTIFTITAVIYSPKKTYTVKTILTIGSVGDYSIQPPEIITANVRAEILLDAYKNGFSIKEIIKTDTPTKFSTTINGKDGILIYTINYNSSKKIIDFTITTESPKESVKIAKKIGDFIIEQHRPLYQKALKQVERILAELMKMTIYVDEKFLSTKLVFENQKYPTSYLALPVIPLNPDTTPMNKVTIRISLAIILSILFGVIISLSMEYIFKLIHQLSKREK